MIRKISDSGGSSVVIIKWAAAKEQSGTLLGLRLVLERKVSRVWYRVHILLLLSHSVYTQIKKVNKNLIKIQWVILQRLNEFQI